MNSDEKLAFLQSTSLANVLTIQEMVLMSHHINIIHASQGDYITKQGQKSNGMFILVEGDAMVTVKILGSGSANLEKITTGGFIGDIAVIDSEPYAVSVVAASEVTCLHIPNSYFDMLAYLFPETNYKINNIIANRLCEDLKFQHANILSLMQKIAIAPQSMLGEVIKTFNQPSSINFSDVGISLEHLQHTNIFNTFSVEELTDLFGYGEIFQAPNQCTLIREGETEPPCFILMRGAAQNSIVQSSKFAKLSVLGPMSLFCGMVYVIPETRALFNYTTCEQAIFIRINFQQMQTIKNMQPELWYKLYHLICISFARLKRSADKLEIRLNSESYNR